MEAAEFLINHPDMTLLPPASWRYCPDCDEAVLAPVKTLEKMPTELAAPVAMGHVSHGAINS